MQFTPFIKQSLEKTSAIAQNYFGNVTSSVKEGDNNQVLTEADLAIGTYIIQEIKKTYPDHNIIDEEVGVIDNQSDYTWVIDPIDGTSNFAAGSPLYGIYIGLLFKHKPIAGGIALPYFGDITTAEKGEGTENNGKKIYVSKEKLLKNVLVGYEIDGHSENPQQTHKETKLLGEIILKCRNMRNSGCAFDIIMLAKGAYGGRVSQTTKIWDNVAPHIILEEAGGLYTDFFGGEMDYSEGLTNPQKNYTYCAASPILHKQLQEIINNVTF